MLMRVFEPKMRSKSYLGGFSLQKHVEILGRDETIKMDVKASDTIASVKDKIKSETSIPLIHQKLIMGTRRA